MSPSLEGEYCSHDSELSFYIIDSLATMAIVEPRMQILCLSQFDRLLLSVIAAALVYLCVRGTADSAHAQMITYSVLAVGAGSLFASDLASVFSGLDSVFASDLDSLAPLLLRA